MGIQVRQSNQVQASRLNIGPGAPRQRVLNTQNTVDQQNLQTGLKAAGGAADAFLKKQIEDDEVQQAADLLSAGNGYREDMRAWEADYKLNNQGIKARNAPADWAVKNKEVSAKHGEQFAGDPRLQVMWGKKSSQLNNTSLNGAQTFYDQQNALHIKNTEEETTKVYFNNVAIQAYEPKAIKNLSAQNLVDMKALNPGITKAELELYATNMDKTIAGIQVDTAVADDKPDIAELMLYGDDKSPGLINDLGDAAPAYIQKVRNLRITHDAYANSEQISAESAASEPPWTLAMKDARSKELAGKDIEIDAATRKTVGARHTMERKFKTERRDMLIAAYNEGIINSNSNEDLRQLLLRLRQEKGFDATTITRIQNNIMRGVRVPLDSKPAKYTEAQNLIATGKIKNERDLENGYTWDLSSSDMTRLKERIKGTGGQRVIDFEARLDLKLKEMFKENTSTDIGKRKYLKEKMKRWNDSYRKYNQGTEPSDKEMLDQQELIFGDVIFNENWTIFGGDKTMSLGLVDTIDVNKIDAPESERAAIYKSLTKKKKAITEDNINQAYYDGLKELGRAYYDGPKKAGR